MEPVDRSALHFAGEVTVEHARRTDPEQVRPLVESTRIRLA